MFGYQIHTTVNFNKLSLNRVHSLNRYIVNLVSISLLMIVSFNSYSQLSNTNPNYKRANTWYIKNEIGLDFNTTPPTILRDGKLICDEGSSAISDLNGDLLFYTNGEVIWNRNHDTMSNGYGLNGNQSSRQGVVIANHPDNDSLYYVFTSNRYDTKEVNGLKYSVVNINENMGLGKVIEKNVPLITEPMTEALNLVNHGNGRDVWLVSHGWGNRNYFAFLITQNGVISCPIISETGSWFSRDDLGNAWNHLKFSPDGNSIAISYNRDARVEISGFNNFDGTVEFKYYTKPHIFPVGIDFSPQGKYLYINERDGYLIRLNTEDRTLFRIHKYEEFELPGQIQLGPDGKVYVATSDSSFIGVINEPDNDGWEVEYERTSITGIPAYFYDALPGFNQSYFHHRAIDFDYEIDCNTNTIRLSGKDTFGATKHQFDIQRLPNGSTKHLHKKDTSYTFWYARPYKITYLASTLDGRKEQITKIVDVLPRVQAEFLGKDTFYCTGGYFTQTLKVPEGLHCWYWQDGSREDNLRIDTAGVYWAEVTTANLCTFRDSIVVMKSTMEKPQIELKWDTLYCKQDYQEYKWFKDEIIVSLNGDKYGLKDTGRYYLIGLNTHGCRDTSNTIHVRSLKYPTGNKLIVYPNSTKGKVKILLPFSDDYMYKIFSNAGSVVSEGVIIGRDVELDLSNFAQGVYLLKMINSRGVEYSEKIVKR